MSELHRVGPLHIAGAHVFVDTPDANFAAALRWSFADLAVPDDEQPDAVHVFLAEERPEPSVAWRLLRDGQPAGATLAEGYVLFHLQWHFNKLVLERNEATVHAACVARDGRAVLLVGASHSGKTTLAGHLATRGWGYVADEVTTIHGTGAALPFHRPLGLRAGGPLDVVHPDSFDRRFDRYEMLVPVSSLGDGIALVGDPVDIGAIVFPHYVPDAEFSVTRLRHAAALERLCASSPGLARHGTPVFRRLAALVAEVPAVEMEQSDLSQAESAIGELVAAGVTLP